MLDSPIGSNLEDMEESSMLVSLFQFILNHMCNPNALGRSLTDTTDNYC